MRHYKADNIIGDADSDSCNNNTNRLATRHVIETQAAKISTSRLIDLDMNKLFLPASLRKGSSPYVTRGHVPQ